MISTYFPLLSCCFADFLQHIIIRFFIITCPSGSVITLWYILHKTDPYWESR